MIRNTKSLWRGRPFRSFHLTVRPVGNRCNLDCTYCPYHNPAGDDPGQIMSLQILERTVRQAVEGQNAPCLVFSWQGGEPLLAGQGFFEEALALQKECVPAQVQVVNEVQTNGLLLDPEWCDFFRRHHFRIALSSDGAPSLHDFYRRDREGKGTGRRVLNAALMLHQHQVPFTALVTVNRRSVLEPEAIYEFVRRRLRASAIHFIPIIERHAEEAPGKWSPRDMRSVGNNQLRPSRLGPVTDWSVDFDAFGDFLIRVFDLWREDGAPDFPIANFDALLAQWLDEPVRFCEMGEVCGSSLAVDWDGTVYSCPYYLHPEYALGNVRERQLGEMAISPEQTTFGQAKANVSQDCKECEFLFACHGGCPRRRFAKTARGEAIDMLCPSLQAFNRHAGPFFRVFAQSVRDNA
jgi:uncharacterized protein